MPPVLTANPIAFHYNIISLVARFRDITLVSALDRQDFRENAGVCGSRRGCGRTGYVMDRWTVLSPGRICWQITPGSTHYTGWGRQIVVAF